MNKAIRALIFSLISSVLIIAGCGPQTSNAPEIVAEDAQNDLHEASLPKVDTDTTPPEPPTRRVIQLPDQVEVEPTKIINTREDHVATEGVDYHITRHVWQPVEIRHTIYEHRNLFLKDQWFNLPNLGMPVVGAAR